MKSSNTLFATIFALILLSASGLAQSRRPCEYGQPADPGYMCVVVPVADVHIADNGRGPRYLSPVGMTQTIEVPEGAMPPQYVTLPSRPVVLDPPCRRGYSQAYYQNNYPQGPVVYDNGPYYSQGEVYRDGRHSTGMVVATATATGAIGYIIGHAVGNHHHRH